ncbi:hypothetical protein [Actinacidiphila yeochonensis]|uniref:hypothetical protein n=1 Tax=Actinacidiphila yeochonensis TaxID=89050 RepID=UPI0012FEE318|nr:hypothetical protein [Actinacidiphila yeochonensis]
MRAAVMAAPHGSVQIEDVERQLRCGLQSHESSEHCAFVVELDGADAGAVWTRWTDGTCPSALMVLPDCAATDKASREPCGEFGGHPGGHTYQLVDE